MIIDLFADSIQNGNACIQVFGNAVALHRPPAPPKSGIDSRQKIGSHQVIRVRHHNNVILIIRNPGQCRIDCLRHR